MQHNEDVVVRGGHISLAALLGILFIGLKLTGYISWSWWLVLLPIYGPMLFWIVILMMVLLFVKR